MPPFEARQSTVRSKERLVILAHICQGLLRAPFSVYLVSEVAQTLISSVLHGIPLAVDQRFTRLQTLKRRVYWPWKG